MIHSLLAILTGLVSLVAQVVDVVDFAGAAEELVAGIHACGALAGCRRAGAVHLDADHIGGRIVAGHEEGLVRLTLHRVGGDSATDVRVAIGNHDSEVTDGRSIVVRGIGIDVGLIGVLHLVVPHVHALDGVGSLIEGIEVTNPGEILSRPVEGVRVVARIVLHLATLDIQGGQVGQLIVPLDGRHAAGGAQFAITTAGDEVAMQIVLCHNRLLVAVGQRQQGAIAWTAGVPGLYD